MRNKLVALHLAGTAVLAGACAAVGIQAAGANGFGLREAADFLPVVGGATAFSGAYVIGRIKEFLGRRHGDRSNAWEASRSKEMLLLVDQAQARGVFAREFGQGGWLVIHRNGAAERLSDQQFVEFEKQMAASGESLTRYELPKDAKCEGDVVIRTYVGGRLHGDTVEQPAIAVLRGDVVTCGYAAFGMRLEAPNPMPRPKPDAPEIGMGMAAAAI